MSPPDLRPAARRLGELVAAVPEDRMDQPTPCADYRVGDLVHHIGGLAIAFTAAARKAGDAAPGGPSVDASQLLHDWREQIPRDLAALGEAWTDPAAWTGTTAAGGVELPGDVAGLVALDEVVIHGWDLARGSGQDYEVDPASLDAVHEFVSQFSGPEDDAERASGAGLFGPVVAVPDDAPLLDRVLGLTGRDPAWQPG